MHFKKIPKTYLFSWKTAISKNILLCSVDDLFSKMLAFLTYASVAQWYITGLQM